MFCSFCVPLQHWNLSLPFIRKCVRTTTRTMVIIIFKACCKILWEVWRKSFWRFQLIFDQGWAAVYQKWGQSSSFSHLLPQVKRFVSGFLSISTNCCERASHISWFADSISFSEIKLYLFESNTNIYQHIGNVNLFCLSLSTFSSTACVFPSTFESPHPTLHPTQSLNALPSPMSQWTTSKFRI